MARTRFASVDEYLAAQPEASRAVLERVRAIIRKALPGAEEVISYQILAYRLHGAYVVYLSGFARHYSIYPVTDGLVEALGDELTPHLAGKGTLRFSLAEPVPARLITRIVRLREREAAASAKAKAAAKGTPRPRPASGGSPRR